MSSPWVAEPEHPDALVREKTGAGWDAWRARVAAGPGLDAGHTAIATWLRGEGVDAWWAQAVTVGIERITGQRLPGQMPDGSFSVARSRTLRGGRDELRGLLLDDSARARLVPAIETVLRSKPEAKALRFAATAEGASVGRVQFTIDEVAPERVRVTVTHEQLASPAEAERWKAVWSDWLDSLLEANLN